MRRSGEEGERGHAVVFSGACLSTGWHAAAAVTVFLIRPHEGTCRPASESGESGGVCVQCEQEHLEGKQWQYAI